jgi:transcriptional regulator
MHTGPREAGYPLVNSTGVYIEELHRLHIQTESKRRIYAMSICRRFLSWYGRNMYTPSHFSEADSGRIAAFIEEYGFGTLISNSAAGLRITHAPLQFDPTRGANGTLIGHIARANPHAALFVDDAEIIAIFQGPHGYISPTWYVEEDSNDPNVPTWNYVAVHVYGRVNRIDDNIGKWKIVTELAAQYERAIEQPWGPGKLATHADKLAAIVGFEIAIDRIEAKTKLSQNRSVADQRNVIAMLESGSRASDRAMARLMRENIARKTGN